MKPQLISIKFNNKIKAQLNSIKNNPFKLMMFNIEPQMFHSKFSLNDQ